MLTVPTSYAEAVAYLDAHIGLGVRPGLERISRLLALLDSPHRQVPVIHIAGTNGKTTTALLASAVLTGHGLTPGTFTSPHLEAVEERFRVADEIATPDEFARAIADIAPFVDLLEAETGERPTYFELTVAAAFAFFAERAVDVAVVEVGLGGRLDATNVVDSGVAVVTSVGLDHTEYLGETLEQIATEKLAIVKPESVLVTGALAPSVEGLARQRARTVGVHHRAFGDDYEVEDATLAVGGWMTTIRAPESRYEDVFLPLHGRHQVDNLAVALAATEALFGRGLDPDAVRASIAEVRSPGRIEVVGTSPLLVVDGAHNEASMAMLAETVENEFPDLSWTVVFGVLGDKDLEAMLGHLEPRIGRLIVTAADSPRAVPAEALAASIRAALPDIPEVRVIEPVQEAVAEALDTTDTDGAVLVTGSLYVVGEARRHLMRG